MLYNISRIFKGTKYFILFNVPIILKHLFDMFMRMLDIQRYYKGEVNQNVYRSKDWWCTGENIQLATFFSTATAAALTPFRPSH